jgi:hypothetical protein
LNLQQIETHFRNKEKLLGTLADTQDFNLIYSLITQVRQLREENDRLTLLNRHYYHTFYPGNIEKMEQDFKYLFDLNIE